MEDTKRTYSPMNQLSGVHMGTQRLKQQTRGLQWSAPRPLCMLLLLVWCVSGIPSRGRGCICDFLILLWDSFPLIRFPCPLLIWGFCLDYYFCFCPGWLSSLRGLLFSEEKNRGRVDLGEKGGSVWS